MSKCKQFNQKIATKIKEKNVVTDDIIVIIVILLLGWVAGAKTSPGIEHRTTIKNYRYTTNTPHLDLKQKLWSNTVRLIS